MKHMSPGPPPMTMGNTVSETPGRFPVLLLTVLLMAVLLAMAVLLRWARLAFTLSFKR